NPGLEAIIIGQEKKVEHLKKGLGMPNRKHNIFVTGPEDEEREDLIKAVIEDYIKKMPEEDYKKKISQIKEFVAVYNFSDPNHPAILEFSARKGETFEKELNETTEYILKEGIKKYEQDIKKKKIVLACDEDIQKRADGLTSQGNKISKEANDAEKEAKKLIQESNKLAHDNPKKKEYEDKIMSLKEKVAGLDQQLAQMQNEYKNVLAEGQKGAEEKCKDFYINNIVRPTMCKLIVGYGSDNPKVVEYLQELEKGLLEDVEAELKLMFDSQAGAERQVSIMGLGSFTMPAPQNGAKDFSQYKAKLLNKLEPGEGVRGIPVIFDNDPTVNRLFGTIPLQESYATSPFGAGSAKKDQHLNLKPGSFIRSIGGYIILETMSSIDSLMRLVKHLDLGKTKIENVLYSHILDKSSGNIDCSNVRVILSGKEDLYQMLTAYSKDGVLKFERTFEHKVELDPTAENTKQTREKYAKKIGRFCREEGLKGMTPEGLAKIVEYSARLTGRQDKLMALNLLQIKNLVKEADTEVKGSEAISAEHVQKAIVDKRDRHSLCEEKVHEYITDGDVFIDTDKSMPGSINGIGVYSLEDARFGSPLRITCVKSLGQKRVISVDRSAKLTGKIAEKAEDILEGNLERLFGQDKNIPLNIKLAFEQSYGGIDGDSATLAEFIVTMSALSGEPVYQGIAVTGSLNQLGKVQPIGGVNEKVEGIYDICKAKGLNGEQGVMIPKTNVKDLMLREDVTEAVKAGKFHVYAVETPEEAIEVAMGLNPGTPGDFKEGTLYCKIDNEIKSLNKAAKGKNK
ncbi:MAG: AAA family ATPase, partial [Nanoarchaeota archaeon]|nr:AAA family ATPase [Nanoarchaeota archaeon]